MRRIKCLIVDDELIARKGIEKYVRQIGFLDVRGVCKNALQAREIMSQEPVDLLFLDINMPGIFGTAFLRTLKNAPYVVFTTAYSEYALESFEFDVIDYLIKPISFERFLVAANKAFRLIPSSEDNADSFLFVKSDRKLIKIAVKSVLYIQADQNYVHVVTTDAQYMVLMALKSVIEMLPKANFLQIHRGCVVAVDKIDAMDGNQLVLGKHKLVISRSYREQVKEVLFKNNILGR